MTTKRRESGFTLVELLVVSVLLALLSTILHGTLSGIMRCRSLVESERDNTLAAQRILSRISRELSARVRTPLRQEDDATEGGEESTPARAKWFAFWRQTSTVPPRYKRQKVKGFHEGIKDGKRKNGSKF